MKKGRLPDLALVLVGGLAVALLPGLFASEFEFGSIKVRSEQLVLGYCVIVMAVLGVGGAFEARKRISAAFRRHRRAQGVFLVLIWAVFLAVAGLVLWQFLLAFFT